MKNNSILNIFVLVLMLAGLLAASGCGYRFSGGGALPSGTGDICISIFENRSSETLLENSLTNDTIYEFTRNGQSVKRNESASESLMTGVILSVTTESTTRATNYTSVEKKVKVVISITLKNSKGKTLWENSELRCEETFQADTNNEIEKTYKKEALVKLSKRFASDLYAKMTENF